MGEETKTTDRVESVEPDFVRRILFPIIIFLSLCLGTYWISIRSPLQFDDFTVIRNISADDPFNRCDTPRRILANVTFAFNHIVHQKSTFGYHLINCIIHALAGLGLFTCILQFPLKEGRRRRLAWSAGLIFLLHPLATHSVTYISQRYSSLAGMFALWSLAYYARGRRLNCWRCLSVSGLLAILAMLCKEYVAGLLPLAIALDAFIFAPSESLPLSKKVWGIMTRSLVLLPATLLFLWVYFYVGRAPVAPEHAVPTITQPIEHGFADWSGQTVSRANYMRTQWKIIPKVYFKLLIVPIGLNVDHPYTISPSWKDSTAWAWAVLLALIFGSAFVLYRKWPIPAFGIVMIYITLAPTSTLVPNTEFVAEQRTYMAIAGFALIVGTLISRLSEQKYRTLLWVYLLLLGGMTVYRNEMWNSSLALWEDASRKNPTSARAFNAVGSIYMRQERFAEAEDQFRKALEAQPGYLPAMKSLPFSLFYQGKYEDCIKPFIWRLTREPNNAEVICTLGQAFLYKGDRDRARKAITQALKVDPNHFDASLTMVEIHIKNNELADAETVANSLLKRPLEPWQQKKVRELLAAIHKQRSQYSPLPQPDRKPVPVPAP